MILSELLPVLDHGHGAGSHHGNGIRLGAIGLKRPLVITRPGLPIDMGMIVVSQVDRGNLACIGEVLFRVKRVEELRLDAAVPESIEGARIQGIVPVAGGLGYHW